MNEQGPQFTASRTSFRDPVPHQEQMGSAPKLEPSRVINIDNLPEATTRAGLRKELRPWGDIRVVALHRHLRDRNCQVGHVVFDLPTPARCAALAMNQARINGQQVRVRLCDSYGDLSTEVHRLYERSFGTVVCARNLPAAVPLEHIGEAFATHGEVSELEQIEMRQGCGAGPLLMVFIWYRKSADAHAAVLAFDGASPFTDSRPHSAKDHSSGYPPYEAEVIRDVDIDSEKLHYGAPGGSSLTKRVAWRPRSVNTTPNSSALTTPRGSGPMPIAAGPQHFGNQPSPANVNGRASFTEFPPHFHPQSQPQPQPPHQPLQQPHASGAHLMVLSHPDVRQAREAYVGQAQPTFYLQQVGPVMPHPSAVLAGAPPQTSFPLMETPSVTLERSIAQIVAEQLAQPHIQQLVQQRVQLILTEINDQVQQLIRLYLAGRISNTDLQRTLDDLISRATCAPVQPLPVV